MVSKRASLSASARSAVWHEKISQKRLLARSIKGTLMRLLGMECFWTDLGLAGTRLNWD
jgi:hypothetical protein